MRRRDFLAASVLAGVAGCSLPRGGRRPVRVLSYNIHHGEGVDGKLDLERIARVIRDTGADLVALQEVDQNARRTGGRDQAREFEQLTGLKAYFGKAMDFEGGAYGQVLLSRWGLRGFEVHRLPNPSGREPRIAISGSVRPPGGPEFRFAGTHLDHVTDDRDRWEQAGKLLEVFGGNEPTVLIGDFNSRPESRVMQRMLAAWEDAARTKPEPTIPAEAPKARIDYVLLRPAGFWTVRDVRVWPEAEASDHRPVLAELWTSDKVGRE